jgi:mono/diheme cytochrome c family protein
VITPRVRFWLVVVVGLCVPGSGSAQEHCTRGTEISVPAICGIAVPNPRISCVVPPDVAPGFQEGTAAQRAFNIFGWQQFIALNWPAAPTVHGSPDQSRPIAAPGPRVWETWKETAEVYLPDGRKPPAWNAWPTGERTKQLVRTQKVEDVLDSAIQPTGADGTLPITLTDRNQRLVRYEIRMNRVLFIDDLTAAWRQRHGGRPAPSGFAPIATKVPDAANGQKVFQQRCAFCHGADGGGRYASGTYYRPALWGPHSFDADAGMAKPATFAAFVHANMPFGSGGALTEQEAWDLAGFVDRQCRPKKPGC